MEKILVIGASGSLGQEICNNLNKEYNVYGTYNRHKKENSNIEYVQLDITKVDSFKQLSDHSYDTVILISGAMPASMKGYTPQVYVDVNVRGALNVLEFCRTNNVRKLIYVMTFSDVSGSFYSGVPIKNNDPRSLTLSGDHAVYAISKVAACDLIEHYHQEYGLQTIVFRIPTVYCCDENVNYYVNGKNQTKAYIKMIRSVVQDKKIELWGDINNAKDMPYIKDFSRLIFYAVKNKTAQGMYNAGTGTPVRLEKLVDTIIDVFGEGDKVIKTYKPEKSSQPNFTFDMSETEKDFGYTPCYNIENMLKDIKKNTDEKIWHDENV